MATTNKRIKDQIHGMIATSNGFALEMTLRFLVLLSGLPEYASRTAVAHMENIALLRGRKDLIWGDKK